MKLLRSSRAVPWRGAVQKCGDLRRRGILIKISRSLPRLVFVSNGNFLYDSLHVNLDVHVKRKQRYCKISYSSPINRYHRETHSHHLIIHVNC